MSVIGIQWGLAERCSTVMKYAPPKAAADLTCEGMILGITPQLIDVMISSEVDQLGSWRYPRRVWQQMRDM